MAKQNSGADQISEISYDRDAEVRDLLKKRERKNPTLAERCASALLTICRPDASGKLVPVINSNEAKKMSAQDVISRFEFDHVVLHALSGSNHPSNLVPRPKIEHREKSRGDTSVVAKVRRVAPAHEDHMRSMLSKSGQCDPPPERQKSKVKIKSRGFAGSRKFNGDVTWKK